MRKNDWTTPPGGSRSPRRIAKTMLTSFIVGVLSIGMAWAGAGLVPISTDKEATKTSAPGDIKGFVGADAEGEAPSAPSFAPADLQPGQILAGAAKVSLYPRPEDYQAQFPGARWEQDQTKCEITGAAGAQEGLSDVADFRVRWPENRDCIYMGGYGIGPVNAITSWDEEYGLYVRSTAMQDANGDALVLTLIDAVYWQALYNNLCPGEPCGFLDLADQLAAETGLSPDSFIFVSNHSHTAPDFIGGWGAVPDWYMQQAADSLKASVRGALASMEPAVLETGEEIVRARNGERRKHYRSAEENTLSWFRLIDADDQPRPEVCTTPPAPTPTPTKNGNGNSNGNAGTYTPPAPPPTCEPAAPGRAIATVGAYAAHPVTEEEGDGEGDADFAGVFAKRVEESYGGVGMFLQTGLGNLSPRGNKLEMGNGLAAAIPTMGSGTQVTNTDVKVARRFWDQPVTNSVIGSAGATGVFDRPMNQAPAAINVGESSYQNKKCTSASPVSVNTSVSAAKVGSLWVTGGPGELFSNFTNTLEERNPNGVTMALSMANDALGYLVQSFETDNVARQGVGFANGPASEYEDAYSLDHCIGDAALEYTIELLGSL